MRNKIIRKLIKYVIAIIITMYLWGFGAAGVSSDNDFLVAGGIAILLALVCGWIWLFSGEAKNS